MRNPVTSVKPQPPILRWRLALAPFPALPFLPRAPTEAWSRSAPARSAPASPSACAWPPSPRQPPATPPPSPPGS
eukprot:599965-Prymnesium_polylepis.1